MKKALMAIALLAAGCGGGGPEVIESGPTARTVLCGICGSDGTADVDVGGEDVNDVPSVQAWSGTAAERSPVQPESITLDHSGALHFDCSAPFALYWVVIVR